MKAKFSSTYTDKNDGTKCKTTVTVHKLDLIKDLGHKFVFIETIHTEPDRRGIVEEISIPLKDIPKLIKALQKSLEKK
jgi:hypothetical protein